MEKSKIEKVAIKLSKMFEDSEDMQYYINKLAYIRKNNPDYFGIFKKEDIIKLIFLISSLKRTNSLDAGKKLIENLEFFAFFYLTGEHMVDECEFCSGNGSINCESCDGTGDENCDACDGSGEVECSSCEGTGCEDCDDEGMEECGECSGIGNFKCSRCGGDGDEECGDCDGNGQIENYDSKEYINYYVACWDKNLIRTAFDFSELKKGFMDSDDFFEKYDKKFLVLFTETRYSEFEDLDDDMIYFYDVEDIPNELTFSLGGGFYYGGEPRNYFK